jgi:putative endonuclease
LARALAWHARGRRFDPDILHLETVQSNLYGFFMPFFLYLIYSLTIDQYYTGHTSDLEDRLYRHNNSGSKSTKKAKDWKIVYMKSFETRSDAMRREVEIKQKRNRKNIEELINKYGNRVAPSCKVRLFS